MLLPVLDLACPVEGKADVQGLCHKAGDLQLEQTHSLAMSIIRYKALARTNPSTTLLHALAWLSIISPTERSMWPPVPEAKTV